MIKVLPLFFWIPTTLLGLVIGLFLLADISKPIVSQISTEEQPIIPARQVLGSYHSNVISNDARPEIVARFLEYHQCPLTPYKHYGKLFVDTADKYLLDFRLLPAISMQESNCCKKAPAGSNNCWGYGIYADKMVNFETVDQGIDIVARTLAKNYTTEGLMEPDEIMNKYTPSSKGSWAYGVLFFMNEMK